MTTHRVLLVEDNAAAAAFITAQLAEGGLMAETVSGGLEALRRAHSQSFALALVDVDLGSEPDGIVTADWLHRLYGVAVVVFAMRSAAESQQIASLAGPAGVVEPGSGELPGFIANLLEAFKPRRSWDEFIADANTIRRALGHGVGGGRNRASAPRTHALPDGFARLSGREWQIIHDLIETPHAQAVATRQQKSPHTVHNHLKSIFKKLHVHSVAELLSLMLRASRQVVSL